MPRFVVHKHHAKHLHYDFRLEHDGVLISWAVPKGPSMNPADKRLCVRVEDHELSYIDFQGEIPEGEYGAGRVEIWDKGEYEIIKGSIESGKTEILLTGDKLKGAFALFRMKGHDKEWLMVKKKEG